MSDDLSPDDIFRFLDPPKEDIIQKFLDSKVPGLEITDPGTIEKFLPKQRRFIIHRGLVCIPATPQPVSNSKLVDDDKVIVVVRSGRFYMINKEVAGK